MPGSCYRPTDLIDCTASLFRSVGCDGDKPAVIAAGLVAADRIGHTTHGLQLAAAYLAELESGGMQPTGEPDVVADRGACITWDGKRLPGVWLTTKAVDVAIESAAAHGTATVVIRNAHHIGCLAVF